MRVLVGVDDTDNLESRGTGYLARDLGSQLQIAKLAVLKGITRHQLLVDLRIPYTSHNSSACLELELLSTISELATFCRNYLQSRAATGSDAGFCLCPFDQVNDDMIHFGSQAKTSVLNMEKASELACEHNFHLEGVTGTHGGIIGALAAVGLRREGTDGRFLWLPNLRDIREPISAAELIQRTGIGKISTQTGEIISGSEIVHPGDWFRPVLLEGIPVIYVEEVSHNGHSEWRVIPKEIIKRLSQ